jgi:hypothetical protein
MQTRTPSFNSVLPRIRIRYEKQNVIERNPVAMHVNYEMQARNS